MSISSICRRCHRLRSVNEARYCEACDKELRAMEKRRPVAKAPAFDTNESHAAVKAGLVYLSPSFDNGPSTPPNDEQLFLLPEIKDSTP